MSLVAYGDSDCESDEDNCITAGVEIPSTNGDHNIETKIIGNKPFLILPQPITNLNEKISEDYDSIKEEKLVVQSKKPIVNSSQEKREEFSLFPTLPKPKAGGKVKITIPSLNEVDINLK